MDQPLCKISFFFSTLWELHFWGPETLISIQNIKKCFFLAFCPKKFIRKRSIFGQKPWTNPFAKFRFFFLLCENFTFEVQKTLFSFQNIKQCFFLGFGSKKFIRKRSIFWQKPWTNPFAKCRFFFTLLELHFSGLKSILYCPEYQKMFLFYRENEKMFFFVFFFSNKNIWERGRFFEKNHELTPLENVDFFRLCENFTFEVQKALFSIQNIKKCFFLAFFAQNKKTYNKTVHFLKKTMD